MMMKMKSKLPWVVGLLIGIPLILSVFSSGYFYQFDIDELHHANLVYLYHLGLVPYKDIYNSVYTPLFEWFLTPLFFIKGFSFDTIALSRFLMIALFIIRTTASFLLVQAVFDSIVALLFLPLFLLDPFVVFSSMQVRPDNLMMTLWTIGLLLLARKRQFSSGICIGLALLTLIKILPSFFIVLVLLILYRRLLRFAVGFAIPIILFLLYLTYVGALPEFIRQFGQSKTAYDIFRYPVPIGNFYLPNNIYVFGSAGKPLPWVYVWILPLLAAAGVYQLVTHLNKKDMLPILLMLSLGAQWFSLFPLPVVFMQHYLPISWLFSVFAAVSLSQIIQKNKIVAIFFLICFVLFATASTKANINRSHMEGGELIARYEFLWRKIPADKSAFPALLFRPPVYPVPFGYYLGNVPDPILSRLPPIPETLEAKRVQFLLIDDYLWSLLKPDVQSYITNHYVREQGDPELWKRIDYWPTR